MNPPHLHLSITGFIKICALVLSTMLLMFLYSLYLSETAHPETFITAGIVLSLLLLGYGTGRFCESVYHHGINRTMYYLGFLAWKAAKGKNGYAAEMTKVRKDFQHSFYPKAVRDIPINKALPKQSQPQKDIVAQLQEWAQYEEDCWNGVKRMSSGAVYHGGKELSALQNQAYSLFSTSNPLHPDMFPFTRKMESEIIAMAVSYFHGDPHQQRGLLTSGGTESYREYLYGD